ncbi:hypothetical protein B0H19DRAFT_1131061 [Mycena capillaripes]|nr:hypothetical protein B0H19DRAFT_1131061 [Mycena capillaripes]
MTDDDNSVVRTTTHSYPKREVQAMYRLYGGPPSTCAVTGISEASVQFWHQMPLTFDTERLDTMLSLKLREPRNEGHAGELRENVVQRSTDVFNHPPKSRCPHHNFHHFPAETLPRSGTRVRTRGQGNASGLDTKPLGRSRTS